MGVKILNCQLTKPRWRETGGGYDFDLAERAETSLNNLIASLEAQLHKIKDIKVNHYTTYRHNNGGYDEVWVQYTILYYN